MPIPSHKEWHINLGLSITYHKLYPKAQCKKNPSQINVSEI